jgi:hypothetical protein
MANFQLSITDPATNSPDIAVASGVLGVTDHSNYSTSDEVGHLKADFSEFYKILITLPNGNEYLYSSIGDGDDTVSVPSAGDPSIDYTYLTGDGQYWVTVYALPSYNAGVSYVYSTLNPVYVYSVDKIYKNIQSGTGQLPSSSPLYWEEVSDIELLPSKYRLAQRAVIYADAKKFYARRIYNANCVNLIIGDSWEKLLRDPDFIVAVEMFIGINSIPVLMAASRWDEVDTVINQLKQLSSKGEVL